MYVSDILMAELHSQWAREKRKQIDKTTGKPFEHVWKITGNPEFDEDIAMMQNRGEALPDTVKIDDGVVKIDILNLPFSKLTRIWQAENEAAAVATEDILKVDNMFLARCKDAISNLSQDDLERLSDMVHQRWMQRRLDEKAADPNAWVDESLMVPYSQLTREEQLKDMAHILKGIDVAKMVAKVLEVDYALDRMYEDKPVFTESGKLNYPADLMFASVAEKRMPKFNDVEIQIAKDMFGEASSTARYIQKYLRQPEQEKEQKQKDVEKSQEQ